MKAYPSYLPLLFVLALAPQATKKVAESTDPHALEERLRDEESAGFSGAVLLVRDGAVVHDGAYGLANREKKIRNTPQTVFDIGPAATEFTRAGVLLLVQERRVAFEDPIAKFLKGVPEDKHALTVAELLAARSGLSDVPTPGEAPEAPRDREDALRRILARPLLFAPDTGTASSHADWTVLAALCEVVSGQAYPEFVRTSLLEPALMRDTRFVGEDVSEERLALGYPEQGGPDGAPAPREPASWRVLGWGGMLSTTDDLWRWVRAVEVGLVLASDLSERYFASERLALPTTASSGFGVTFRPDPDSMVILLSNASLAGQHEALARELSALRDPRGP